MRARAAVRLAAASAIAAAAVLLGQSCARDRADRPDIGVVLRANDDPLSAAARKAMSAATTGKADLSFSYSALRAVQQSSLIESYLDKGRGALVVDPVDSLSARSAIAGAKARAVPLVFIGCLPSEEAMLSWDKVFYVGSKDRDAGRAMGEILAESGKKAPARGDGAEELRYVFIAGDPGLAESEERSLGLSEYLEDSELKASRLMDIRTNGTIADARRGAAAALEKLGGKIEAIACADWTIAQGAIEACEKAGRLEGAAPIAIVSVHKSASSPELKAVLASGKIAGAAALDSEAIGKAALSLALLLAEGKDPSRSAFSMSDAKYLWIPYLKVTRDEAAP